MNENLNGQSAKAASAQEEKKNIRIVATNLENGKVVLTKEARNERELDAILTLIMIKAEKNESVLEKVSDNQYVIKDNDGEFVNIQVVEMEG